MKTLSRHTPGPWRIGDPVSNTGISIWRSEGEGANYARICRNVLTPADARLIAAAPDLLAALQKISVMDGSFDKLGAAQMLARAAIDKAVQS